MKAGSLVADVYEDSDEDGNWNRPIWDEVYMGGGSSSMKCTYIFIAAEFGENWIMLSDCINKSTIVGRG